MHILLVDDDEATREMIEMCLGFKNHTVIATENGRDAIESCADNTFDIAVVDREMPEITGEELARELKSLQPQLPIIMLTGHGDDMIEKGHLPEGIDRVVAKPVTPQELIDVMQEMSPD